MKATKKILACAQNKLLVIFIFLLLPAHAAAVEIVKDASFDRENAEVSYKLTRPALVRISLGVEDGPLFSTLVDWQFRRPGLHREKWGKTGMQEIDRLLCNKKTYFTFNYISYGPHQEGFDLNSLLQEEAVIGPIGRSSSRVSLNYLHKNHKRHSCHEPKVNITLPKNIKRTKEGVALIDKPIFLTIDIDPKDKIWFNRERYSLYIFTDNIFTQGLLEGYSPCHWYFDPKGLNNGMHLIIVNLWGFSDHLGVALLPVYVKGGHGKI